MATQNIRLKDADGNVLHPETELMMIQGAQRAPGFLAFGAHILKETDDRIVFPAIAIYRKSPSAEPVIIKAYYFDIDNANFREMDPNDFQPMKTYFAQ